MSKRNGITVWKRYKLKSKLLTSKSTEVLVGSRLIHMWSVIIVCQKDIELSSKNGKRIVKRFSPNLTLIFNLSTQKRERPFSGYGQYICEVSLLYAKNKWISCGNDTKFKDQIWSVLWSFDPKINRGPSQVEVTTFVKYHYCMPKVNGAGVRKR